jgi:hypothetical protein
MSGNPKFIQITSSSVVTDEEIRVHLFALDEEGDIWQYDWAGKRTREEQWLRMATKRKLASPPV